MQHKERIQRFVKEIWQWYAHHKRTLPWRDLQIADDTQRAYMILVSEVMLQQTQVPRVVVIFKQFIERFPTIQDLAKASNRDVLIAWRGMGYNSRALRLRDAARTIVEKYRGRRVMVSGDEPSRRKAAVSPFVSAQGDTVGPHARNSGGFPHSMEELLQIPGIGPYTAAAIRNFAFNLPTPCIDTNIRRILHRTFVGPENADGSWKKDDAYLLKLAGEILRITPCHTELVEVRHGQRSQSILRQAQDDTERFGSADWHAALMDFGSLIQTKSNPKWHLCPLTAAGIMKTTRKSYERAMSDTKKNDSQLTAHSSQLREPGRFVGSKFIPNRIFRGKVVELLRDSPKGLTLENIGREICLDWSRERRAWLQEILTNLQRDSLLKNRGEKYVLS